VDPAANGQPQNYIILTQPSEYTLAMKLLGTTGTTQQSDDVGDQKMILIEAKKRWTGHMAHKAKGNINGIS
jgi:hypothetical protein